MSGTLQASVVKDSASATNNLTLDTGGNVAVGNNLTVAGTTTLTGSLAGNPTTTGTYVMGSSFLRNRIINGAMQISQRTAVNTNVAVGTGTSGTFGPDRYFAYTGTTSLWNTSQVSTGASDFPYANRLQRISGQTSTSAIYWRQIVESVNCTDLSGQSVVLSFYATAGANYSGGAVSAQVYTGTGTDQGAASLNTAAWTGFATPISSTFTPTTTRTRYTFTGTIGSGINELAISLTWSGSGTAGTNDYVDITGVQLEVGTVATPFERQIYSTQLAQCQRYYQQITGAGNATGFSPIGTGFAVSASTALILIPLATTMRQAPTYSFTGTISVGTGLVSPNLTSISTQYTGTGSTGFILAGASAGTMTTGGSVVLYTANATTNSFAMSSEL